MPMSYLLRSRALQNNLLHDTAAGLVRQSRHTMDRRKELLLRVLVCLPLLGRSAAQPGFVSLDCGATDSYVDPTTTISWLPDTGYVSSGSTARVAVDSPAPYTSTLRYFASPNHSKNCYTLGPVNLASRYLIRATFLHGRYDGADVYPVFDLSLDATPWATIQIVNASLTYFEEIIAVAKTASFAVCLMQRSVGVPFISALELRPLLGAMYARDYEAYAHLKYTTRINFGARSPYPVRFPDDPVDRLWMSDMVPGTVQNEAAGTYAVSTNRTVDVGVSSIAAQDRPPAKVMQTAVVGGDNKLFFGIYLPGFPASAYASAYLAEIVDLPAGAKREFTFSLLGGDPSLNNFSVNLQKNQGSYVAWEPGFDNVSLPQLLQFEFTSTPTSNVGPILNALEILKILPIVAPTLDVDEAGLLEFRSLLREVWEGDPCLPMPWNWVVCSSTSPPRVTDIYLSGKNLTGQIPTGISQMTSLVNLWLDNNHLTGSLPDLSQLTSLTTLHVQNNSFSGSLPQSLVTLSRLNELFIQNNNFQGTIPPGLLTKQNLNFLYDGNSRLCASGCSKSSAGVLVKAIAGGVAGGLVVLVAAIAFYFVYMRSRKTKQAHVEESLKDPLNDTSTSTSTLASASATTTSASAVSMERFGQDEDGAQARQFTRQELTEATDQYRRKIGQGGFGPVYYGRLRDGQEIAVKVLAADSRQGAKEFFNEVALLSRVHHRCLVSLLGYCCDDKESMLVYEFMPNGTLKDHLSGPESKMGSLAWMSRLRIALNAATALQYLHEGCNPPIIHRDVKSSNILLDSDLSAKVADFGLSKLMPEQGKADYTISIQGTVGYLDPDYYVLQRLTQKSDVYSFGVVLLEILSGREPIFSGQHPPENTIVYWARTLAQRGDVQGILDPRLEKDYRLEAAWKVAEIALLSVEPHGHHRPSMCDIIRELKDAIAMGSGELEERECPPERTALSTPRPTYQYPDLSFTDSSPSLSSDAVWVP